MMGRLLGVFVATVIIGVAGLAAWLHDAYGWHPVLALLAAASVPVLFDASVLAFQFAIGAWFRRDDPPQARYPLTQSVRAWAGEVVSSLRTFLYAQIRYRNWTLPSPPHAQRVPVLLVHGYFCNRGIWHPFARWLAARGHPVDSVNLEPVFAPIENYPPIVAQGVRRLLERTGASRVAVVGHSMGGLVVRAYLDRYGNDAVCSVVTLGSPHRGTWLARFGIGRNVAQMHPASAWLRELEAREAEGAATRIPFTTIITAHDNIVVPQATQTLDGASKRVIAGRGHVSLAYDHEVWELAVEAIDAGCARPDVGDDRARRSADAPESRALRSGSPA